MEETKTEQSKLSIRDHYHQIQKIAYGKNGFLAFLNRLFICTNSADRKQFNYYFALKKQITYLEETDFDKDK
jgi:hypothetical protein